ncbi:MAG TPA: hypothetical protein VLK34_04420 [Nocardioidaceae bacterium]|nr:hypothetical protein [Nocardioidaceae bacterium]
MSVGMATAALMAGSASGAAVAAPAPAEQEAQASLYVSIDVLVRTSVFPAESCCHWVARHSHEGFRNDTVDRCETGDRLLPGRYGVQTRQFIYRSKPPDRFLLASARSTVVKFTGPHAAKLYYRHYVRDGFDCRPRHVDGGTPGGGTAVYKVVRKAAGHTVIADEVTESGATTMRRYIDTRRVGHFVTIVEYDLGEEIAYRPDLHRVDHIADAQQRRLERRMNI